MNKRATLRLRAMMDANPAFPPGDPRNEQIFNQLKKAYNKLSATDRHPDKLEDALARMLKGQINASI